MPVVAPEVPYPRLPSCGVPEAYSPVYRMPPPPRTTH